MFKILFFDNWGLEIVRQFRRRLQQPVKHPSNPLFIADQPWEEQNMQTYGSILKLPGRPFQLWYSAWQRKPKPYNIVMCYAESDDGLTWRKPLLDVVKYKGRKTNIVMDANVHGPAVVYDPATDHYRMMAGVAPHHCICVFSSKDGIHWSSMNQGPVIANKPDCSMGLVRTRKGQYAAYHRHPSTGRRVCRTTSWDFRFWDNEPKLVFEPDAHDPPQIQFYSMGSSLYGPYELGTLWIYHTREDDLAGWHMKGIQEAELAYSRNGIAWHRAAQGEAFIPHGTGKDWDCGNLQCTTQPVYLDDEIRYYFTGTQREHGTQWEVTSNSVMGLGMATLKPDRFIALEAGAKEAELLTWAVSLPGSDIFVNADVSPRGSLAVELLAPDGKPIQGLSAAECRPIRGDNTAHAVTWQSKHDPGKLEGRSVRFRVLARNARLYSIFGTSPGVKPVYHQFGAPF